MIIKKYFSNLEASVSSIEHYLNVLKKPLKDSFFFFIISIIIIGGLIGINTSEKQLPKAKADLYTTMDELVTNFDPELEIVWTDGQLEMNQDYVKIPWPSIINYKLYELPENIAIISNSETHPTESSLIEDKNTLVYVNKNSFYSLEGSQQNNWEENSLSLAFNDIDSYSINKQNVARITSRSKEAIDKSFYKIKIFFAVFSMLIFILSKAIFLLIESILVYFLFKLYNLNLDFKQILKLTFNIMVPTEIIYLATIIFIPSSNFPIESLAFWVILSFVGFNLRNKKNLSK